jgi:hypothetical protein
MVTPTLTTRIFASVSVHQTRARWHNCSSPIVMRDRQVYMILPLAAAFSSLHSYFNTLTLPHHCGRIDRYLPTYEYVPFAGAARDETAEKIRSFDNSR